jgi:epoxide hydrolase
MTTASSTIRSFRIEIPQESLDDLHDRLSRVRWASEIPGEPAEDYGVSLAWVRELAGYWRDGYDWRAAEARLNEYPQFMTEIDGQDIHFLRIESPEPGAIPLILTHGWPGSVVEFLNVIGPLTDPRAHGKDPSTAFELVIPSLPGFAFSAPLRDRGWSTQRTAAAWVTLMHRLGYERYGAAGNDAGSMISPEVGRLDPEHVIAVHATQVYSFPSGTRPSSQACPPKTAPRCGNCNGSWTTRCRSTNYSRSSHRRWHTHSLTPRSACSAGTPSS